MRDSFLLFGVLALLGVVMILDAGRQSQGISIKFTGSQVFPSVGVGASGQRQSYIVVTLERDKLFER